MPAATPPSGANDGRSVQILRWLARFSLLAECHLQALLGGEERPVIRTLAALRAQGLIGMVAPDSPEFVAPQRLYHLTDLGVTAAADAAGMTVAALAERFPIGRAERLSRLIRAETAVAVAGFVAALASDLRGEDEARLDDAWGTHWARPAGSPPAPPLVEACVRVRVGGASATFSLAWDRAGAPAAHRRRRIAAWFRADEAREAGQGASLPPVLVVSPDERTLGQWAIAAERGAVRRARAALPLALGLAAEVAGRGPLHARWLGPGERDGTALVDRLAWRSGSPTSPGRLAPRAAAPPSSMAAAAAHQVSEPLGAGSQAGSDEPSAHHASRSWRRERWATLAVELSAAQKRLLEWIGHHPLLPTAHLALHADLPPRSIASLLADLLRRDLVAIEVLSGGLGTEQERYVLTAGGAAFLAARDGVPTRLYLTEGVIVADGGTARAGGDTSEHMSVPVRLAHLRRHPEHTIGVQRFAVALAREAARQRLLGRDCRLLAWLNDAEGQLWFRHEGRVRHIWPDARFRYRADGTDYDLLLEWDRGLGRRRDYLRKLDAYAAYFSNIDRSRRDCQRLLIVTTAAAEDRVHGILNEVAGHCRVLDAVTSVITMSAAGRAGGPRARRLGSPLERMVQGSGSW